MGKKEVAISSDVMEYQMNSASIFAKEEKLPITKIVKIFRDANRACFTVCFACKIDEKEVKDKLSKCSEKDFMNGKALAKDFDRQ